MGKNNHPECCPAGSLAEASAARCGERRKTQGREVVVSAGGEHEEFTAYLTGPPEGRSIRAGIVFCHDIFGYAGGRSFHMMDDLAKHGYLVICPDLFDLKSEVNKAGPLREREDLYWPPWKLLFGPSRLAQRLRLPWAMVEKKLLASIDVLRAESGLGASLRVGAIGTCYGGWVITRAGGMPNPPILCGAGWHPSPDVQRLQATGPTTSEMLRAVKIPMLLAPSWQDPGYLKPGAWWIKFLNEPHRPSAGSESHLFSEAFHGWSTRGNIDDPKMKRDVDAVFEKTLAFLDRVLANRPASKL